MTNPYENPPADNGPPAPGSPVPGPPPPPPPGGPPPYVQAGGQPYFRTTPGTPPPGALGTPPPFSDFYQGGAWPEQYKVPQSGLGIASFVISIVAVLLILASFAVAIAVAAEGGGRSHLRPEAKPVFMLASCTVIAGGLVAVVGLLLSIIALCQTNRRKGFAVAGVIINALVALGLVALMVIGLNHAG